MIILISNIISSCVDEPQLHLWESLGCPYDIDWLLSWFLTWYLLVGCMQSPQRQKQWDSSICFIARWILLTKACCAVVVSWLNGNRGTICHLEWIVLGTSGKSIHRRDGIKFEMTCFKVQWQQISIYFMVRTAILGTNSQYGFIESCSQHSLLVFSCWLMTEMLKWQARSTWLVSFFHYSLLTTFSVTKSCKFDQTIR
jgi:hypothetical protein